MATRSGGSGARRSSGSGSGQRRSTGARSKSTSGARSRSTSGARRSSTAQTTGADKRVEAFRDALERSVMLSRDRLQEGVDDPVTRRRMTRDDPNELVSNLMTCRRQYTDDLIRDLARPLEQAPRALETL